MLSASKWIKEQNYGLGTAFTIFLYCESRLRGFIFLIMIPLHSLESKANSSFY